MPLWKFVIPEKVYSWRPYPLGKWEYKTARLAEVQIENQLNFLGEEKWELVQVVYQPEEDYPFLCIFKKSLERFA
ncbi:MAG: hypothetical protein ABGX83_05700 [Nitrospira sp.]|nr:hypothetical protein [Candidatus Manganitrophaceae bacterium]HIL34777.1 hypothetical protein [Candidatus Manganitrophaceae bacterium]